MKTILYLLPGAAITVNAVIASCLSNLSTGVILTYALGIALLLGGLFFKSITKRMPKWVAYAALLSLVAITLSVITLFMHGKTDTVTYTEDAVIVLGAGIRGEELSETLQNRLDAAVAYYTQNPTAVIVVSGGQGPQENITEALAMERYLLQCGIEQDHILKEEHATGTAENFQYAKQLLDTHFEGTYTAALITNDYHIYRAQHLASLAGFDDITHFHSDTPWYMIIPNGLREILAVIKLWVFQR